jgi:competence protein ComGC
MKSNSNNEHGDTLVETILAMAVLSMILLISWGLVHRATQVSLAARQRVEMVNQLKEQAEIIKAQYATEKQEVIERELGGDVQVQLVNIADINVDPCVNVASNAVPAGAFYMGITGSPPAITPTIGDVKPIPNTHGKVWIQVVQGTGYLDFHIRGCWQSFGIQKDENSQLRLRLNT